MEIPNYLIHRKLKIGKHYPQELLTLINLFRGGLNTLPFATAKSGRTRYKINWEIHLIEKTFLDFFLNRSSLIKYEFDLTQWKKKHPSIKNPQEEIKKELHRLSEAAQNEPGECSIKVVNGCVERINRKLKFFNPRIQAGGNGYRLNFTPYITSNNSKAFSKKPSLLPVMGWAWLAKVIDSLDPRFVHKCEYCHNIFFSKQIKKFHSECRGKYFSEKYKVEGRNAERQKRYRQRKMKKVRATKTA